MDCQRNIREGHLRQLLLVTTIAGSGGAPVALRPNLTLSTVTGALPRPGMVLIPVSLDFAVTVQQEVDWQVSHTHLLLQIMINFFTMSYFSAATSRGITRHYNIPVTIKTLSFIFTLLLIFVRSIIMA